MKCSTEVTLLILCMKWVSTWSQNCLQDDHGPDLMSEVTEWKMSSKEKLVMGTDHMDVKGHYQQPRLAGYHDTEQEKAATEINGISVNLLEHPSKKKLKLSETEDASVGACVNIESRPWCCTLTMLGWRCCFVDSNNVPHTDNSRWARFYVDGHYLYICRRQRGRWLCSAVRQLRYGEKLPNYLYNIYDEISFENHIAHSEKDASSDKARKRNEATAPTDIDVCLRLLGKMFCCRRDLDAWTCQFTNELSPQNSHGRKHNDQVMTKPLFSIATGLKPLPLFHGNQLPIRSFHQPPTFSSSPITHLNMSHLFPRAKLGTRAAPDFLNLLKPLEMKPLVSLLPKTPSTIQPQLIFNDYKDFATTEVPYQGKLSVGNPRDLRSSATANIPQQATFNNIIKREETIIPRKATATLRRARGALGLAQLSIEQYDDEEPSFVRLNGVDPTLQYSIELGPHGGCGSPTHESQPLTLGLIVGNNAVNRVKLREPLSERLQCKPVTITSIGQDGTSTAYSCGFLYVLPSILVPLTTTAPALPGEASTLSRYRRF